MKYLLMGLFMALALGGCSTRSPSANFYLLENEFSDAAKTGNLRVGLGPVSVADYLQKPQIAIRTNSSQIIFSEFDRWASDLRGLIISSLQHDLATELNTSNVFEYPWRKSDQVEFLIQLDIKRLDASFDDSSAFLEAKVTLGRPHGPSIVRSFALREALDGHQYTAAVAAERRLIQQLAKKITELIQQL